MQPALRFLLRREGVRRLRDFYSDWTLSKITAALLSGGGIWLAWHFREHRFLSELSQPAVLFPVLFFSILLAGFRSFVGARKNYENSAEDYFIGLGPFNDEAKYRYLMFRRKAAALFLTLCFFLLVGRKSNNPFLLSLLFYSMAGAGVYLGGLAENLGRSMEQRSFDRCRRLLVLLLFALGTTYLIFITRRSLTEEPGLIKIWPEISFILFQTPSHLSHLTDGPLFAAIETAVLGFAFRTSGWMIVCLALGTLFLCLCRSLSKHLKRSCEPSVENFSAGVRTFGKSGNRLIIRHPILWSIAKMIQRNPRGLIYGLVSSLFFALLWVPVSLFDSGPFNDCIIPLAIAGFGLLLQRFICYDFRICFPVLGQLRLLPLRWIHLLAAMLFWPVLVSVLLQWMVMIAIRGFDRTVRHFWIDGPFETVRNMSLTGFGLVFLLIPAVTLTGFCVWNLHYLRLFQKQETSAEKATGEIDVKVLGFLGLSFVPAALIASFFNSQPGIFSAIATQMVIALVLCRRLAVVFNKLYI